MDKNKLYRKIGRSKSSRFYCKPRLKQHWNRNTKEGISRSMASKKIGSLDGYSFNPLYKFLNSKANCVWNDVYSEICQRIEPFMKNEINYVVDIVFDKTREHGQAPLGNQHFNMMFIDNNGILRNYIDCEEFKGFKSAKECINYKNNQKNLNKMTKKEQTIDELFIENDNLQIKIKLLEEYLKAKTAESLQLYKELSEMQDGINQLAFNFANTLIMREVNKLTDDEFVVTINNKKFIELVKQVREQIK